MAVEISLHNAGFWSTLARGWDSALGRERGSSSSFRGSARAVHRCRACGAGRALWIARAAPHLRLAPSHARRPGKRSAGRGRVMAFKRPPVRSTFSSTRMR